MNGTTVVRSYFVQGFEERTDDYFYTRDHLGSVRGVVESDGATIASRLSSKAPLGPAGGLNLYGDVGNDPANYLEPDRQAAAAAAGISAAAAGAAVAPWGAWDCAVNGC